MIATFGTPNDHHLEHAIPSPLLISQLTRHTDSELPAAFCAPIDRHTDTAKSSPLSARLLNVTSARHFIATLVKPFGLQLQYALITDALTLSWISDSRALPQCAMVCHFQTGCSLNVLRGHDIHLVDYICTSQSCPRRAARTGPPRSARVGAAGVRSAPRT